MHCLLVDLHQSIGPLSLLPDRGSSTLTGWWTPVVQHIYIEEWELGSGHEVERSRHPTTVNSKPIKRAAASDGMCTTTAVGPLQGLHSATGDRLHRAARLLHRGTGVSPLRCIY